LSLKIFTEDYFE